MSIKHYLGTKTEEISKRIPKPETLMNKVVTPIYLGILFIFVSGVAPLIVSLNNGSSFVPVHGGRYFIGDYTVFVVMRFTVILCGVLLFFLVYMLPKKKMFMFPLLSLIIFLTILMWYI